MPKPSPSALRTDILGRSNLDAPRAAGSDGGIAAWYAASDATGPKADTFLTELGIYLVLGPTDGETFLASLEAVAASSPVVKRTLSILKNGSGTGYPNAGLDFGSAMVQAFLTSLAGQGAVTVAARDALIAYGSRPWSRAEVLWGEGVVITADDVSKALRGL